MEYEYDCLVLGAGLSGLYAALRFQQSGFRCRVLEARERLGGRILSATLGGSRPNGACFDLGPAWIWPEFQPLIGGLARSLGVDLFAQHMGGTALYEGPDHAAPLRLDGESPSARSFRLAGSTFALIEALAARLAPDTVRTGRRVVGLSRQPGGVGVRATSADGGEARYTASQVVSAVPLRLLAEGVRFEPALPAGHAGTFAATPTWMAAHAKFLAVYRSPFWRESGLSGEAFSRRGPLTEIYDASPLRGGPYALFGFFGVPAHARRTLGREALAELGLGQLRRLFGDAALDPLGWEIKDWSADPLTATRADAAAPLGHPAYGLSDGLRTLWDGRVLFAGSEASSGHGGYLEGALEAAEDACTRLARHGK